MAIASLMLVLFSSAEISRLHVPCAFWYFNATFYADHEVFSDTAENDSEVCNETLFSIALMHKGDLKYGKTKQKSETIKAEALAACEIGQWSSFVHMMGLASVVSSPIFSVYPEVNFRYRKLMHRVLKPRTSVSHKLPINILWSRDGNFDNRPGVWFQPSHFVPLVSSAAVEQCTEPVGQNSWENSAPSKSAKKAKQQGTLFSYLKKATAVSMDDSSPNSCDQPPLQKRTVTAAGLSETVSPQDQPVPKKSTSTAPTKRKILHKWKDEFPWLVFHEDQSMTCSVCCESPEMAGKTQFLTGCTSTKKETVQKHASSNGHMRALKATIAKQKPMGETFIVQSFAKGTKDQEENKRREVALKMTTTYFVAKEELPFSKFEGLISLQKKNGVEFNSTYANDKSCAQMVSVLGKVFKERLTAEVNSKNYISVMADGATDAGGMENETIFC